MTSKQLLVPCLILSLLSSISCTRKNEAPQRDLKNIEMELVREFYLPLDNETTTNNPYYQYIDSDSASMLVFFNPLNYHLYFYDLISRELITKLPFEKKGPNAIGDRVTYFNVINRDSILFHSYYSRSLFLNRWSGERIAQHKMFSDNLDVYPESGVGNPVLKIGDSYFLTTGNSCNTTSQDRKSTILTYNEKELSLEASAEYSEAYQLGKSEFWPNQLCTIYKTEHPNGKSLIYSYKLDNHITITDLNTNVQQVEFSHPNFKLKSPLSPATRPSDAMSEFKVSLSYPQYGPILYDKYRNSFIRFFYDETPKNELDQNLLKAYQSLIISDAEFNLKAQANFTGATTVFFNEEGMNQVVYNSKIEDSLKVKVYRYEY